MKPILVVPIIGPLLEDVKTQVLAAEKLGLKIELRLDLIKEDISCLSLKPWIVTCGQFEDKVNLFDSEFIDIDYKFFSKIHDKKDKNIIASYHNFDSTPDDLEALFNKIKQEAPGAYLYKIATYANSTLDALRMLIFLKKMHAQGERLLGVCMGPNGSCTRILSPVFQNPFTFAPIDLHQASAKGQITVEELKNIYFIQKFMLL
jgi:3-dehydroquinate dehydratase type I